MTDLIACDYSTTRYDNILIELAFSSRDIRTQVPTNG